MNGTVGRSSSYGSDSDSDDSDSGPGQSQVGHDDCTQVASIVAAVGTTASMLLLAVQSH
jgi:hypothetical protein